MSETFRFQRRGRSGRALLALVVYYAALIVALVLFRAAPWLIGGLALFSLPALWDLWRNPTAGIELDNATLAWRTGRFEGHIALKDIERIRMDTRWDLSVRVTIITKNGKHLRLPADALPPHRQLAAELTGRNLHPERHHFSIF